MYVQLTDVMGMNRTIVTGNPDLLAEWIKEFIPDIMQGGYSTAYPWQIMIRPSDPNEQIAMNGYNYLSHVLKAGELADNLRSLADMIDPTDETEGTGDGETRSELDRRQ